MMSGIYQVRTSLGDIMAEDNGRSSVANNLFIPGGRGSSMLWKGNKTGHDKYSGASQTLYAKAADTCHRALA
jgi:hypothetical protein